MGGLRAGVVKIPGSQKRKPGPRLGPLHLVAETSQEVVAGRDDTIELMIWTMIKEGWGEGGRCRFSQDLRARFMHTVENLLKARSW